MRARLNNNNRWIIGAIFLPLMLMATQSWAAVQGITGTTFNITTGTAHIDTPDGSRVLVWGYGDDAGSIGPQYPGPTLIVNEGDTVTINLTNKLPQATSMVFPGQDNVAVTGAGTPGEITQESNGPGDTVTYTFTAGSPGTYLYNSGTDMDLQVEMGLVGAIVVRPSVGGKRAYNHDGTSYDHEYMFLLTEMDPKVHQMVEFGIDSLVDTVNFVPTLWFINGRNGPDTLAPNDIGWMPAQPYGSTVQMHAGEKVLLRLLGAGRDPHPFHTHGANFRQIARDGRLNEMSPGSGPNAGVSDYTLQVVPGATYDAIFTWTGKDMGWDILGTPGDGAPAHQCNGLDGPSAGFDATTHEYCGDHYACLSGGGNVVACDANNVKSFTKGLPVAMPELQDLTFGGFYSGSPFLGAASTLPPGEGGLNINGGMFFMWHSHAEKELVNNDVPPGGMLTMMIVEPYDVVID
jgi:FtsP/CotA-like multicopper oxidase with cupredoxin domain